MLWVKAGHLVAMVAWFAGIFYLPRLFVYHAMADDERSKRRFCVMERKLLWGIMTPSALVTVALGTWLAVRLGAAGFAAARWLHVKLALVALLLAYHGACVWFVRRFAAEKNRHSHVFFRVFNEVPVLLLIGIVVLAVVRPL